jgi:hypothetical protein
METYLNVLIFCLKSVEVFVVLLILVIAVDLGIAEFKNNDRTKKTGEPKMLKIQNLIRAIVLLLNGLKARSIKAWDRDQDCKAKHRLRTEKEKSAHDGFFEDSYVRGFDATGAIIHRGVKVPTEKALEYYRKMDELADTQIFDNTEVL